MLMNLFGGLGAGGLAAPHNPNGLISAYFIIFLSLLHPAYFSLILKRSNELSYAVPPEELYATQLSQLQEMGFFDTQENIRALRATSGNVHAAVERLLGNLGQ